jgi:hypothetical protein
MAIRNPSLPGEPGAGDCPRRGGNHPATVETGGNRQYSSSNTRPQLLPVAGGNETERGKGMNGNSTRLPGERFNAMLDGDTVVMSPEELHAILERETEAQYGFRAV